MIITSKIYTPVVVGFGRWAVFGPGLTEQLRPTFERIEDAEEMCRQFSLIWHAGVKDGERKLQERIRVLLGAAGAVQAEDDR